MAWLRRLSDSHFSSSSSSERLRSPLAGFDMPEAGRKTTGPLWRCRRARHWRLLTGDRRRRRKESKGRVQSRACPNNEAIKSLMTKALPRAPSSSVMRAGDSPSAFACVAQPGPRRRRARWARSSSWRDQAAWADYRNLTVGINRKNPIPHEISACAPSPFCSKASESARRFGAAFPYVRADFAVKRRPGWGGCHGIEDRRACAWRGRGIAACGGHHPGADTRATPAGANQRPRRSPGR